MSSCRPTNTIAWYASVQDNIERDLTVSQSNSSGRVRVRLLRMPLWIAVLTAAALLAVLVTIAIVAFGVFLIVFPTLVIAGALFRLFGRGRMWPADHGSVSHPTIIEGEYRVIGTKRLDRDQSD
jgi:hypothetical protein